MIIGIVGSREMSSYGKKVINLLMRDLKNVATINVGGCNQEVIRLGAKKVFTGDDFEKMNIELANYVDKLIVVEGGENSGTFLVAQAVRDLGKEVWAIPGRITDKNSQAPNWLIKSGAKILIDLTEVLQ
jgi:predicted Rossmann fold nucleotide-binding protein DprA/Smf involved in DNA uptake